jgi:hypothetical protein
MQKPPPDPDVADTAPSDSVLTVYDEEHLVTYLRLLDADAEGADWREVTRVVLHLDPEHESDRARRAFDSHLSRAKWMTEHGRGGDVRLFAVARLNAKRGPRERYDNYQLTRNPRSSRSFSLLPTRSA